MPAALSDIHPTLYVVSPWWKRLVSAIWPMDNWLGSSMNHIQDRDTVWACCNHALEKGSVVSLSSSFLMSTSFQSLYQASSPERESPSPPRSRSHSLRSNSPAEVGERLRVGQRLIFENGDPTLLNSILPGINWAISSYLGMNRFLKKRVANSRFFWKKVHWIDSSTLNSWIVATLILHWGSEFGD